MHTVPEIDIRPGRQGRIIFQCLTYKFGIAAGCGYTQFVLGVQVDLEVVEVNLG